jgi:hypothetical protein
MIITKRKNMKKIFLAALVAISICFACTKNDNAPGPVVPPVVEETPLASIIQASPTSYTITTHDPQAKEVGYLFVPLKKGRIYALGVRMPQTGQDFKVTLWDTLTREILKQKTITNASSTGFTYVDLSTGSNNEEVDVQANKAYIISVSTAAVSPASPNRQWYLLSKSGSADFLPITKGHIQILSGRYSTLEEPTTTYPDKDNFSVFGLHLLFGLVDVGYYATEY